MSNAARKPVVCPKCGRPYEDPNRTAGLCYGCHLNALIPPWYQDAEDYDTVVLAEGKGVATYWRARRRPRTGVDVLDAPPPVRVEDIVRVAGRAAIAGRAEAERNEGL